MRFSVDRYEYPKAGEEVEISSLDDLKAFQERQPEGQWPALLLVDFFPDEGLPTIEIYNQYRE